MRKLLLLLCFPLIFSCGDIRESINSIFDSVGENKGRATEEQVRVKQAIEHQTRDITNPAKYEVISKKAYFFSPEELSKAKAYLIEGDIALCGKSSEVLKGNNYDDFYFCWFKHYTGRITTGYLMASDLIFEDQINSSKWHSLTKLYSAKHKTYFFRPQEVTRNRSYLIEGDITICDKDVVEIRGREYCYCEFKKYSGSNTGRVTTGYLERNNLLKW